MANKYVVYKGELLYGEEIGEGIAVDIRADGSMSISQCIYEGEQEEVLLPKEGVERLLNLLNKDRYTVCYGTGVVFDGVLRACPACK